MSETKAPAVDATERILYRAPEKGLSFKTTMGNVLTLTPPLIVSEAQMDRALDIIEECLHGAQSGVTDMALHKGVTPANTPAGNIYHHN